MKTIRGSVVSALRRCAVVGVFGCSAVGAFVGTLTGTLALSAPAQAQVLPTPTVQQPQVDSPQRVLFVGNSYFYYNNSLHNHVRRLVAAGNPAIKESQLEYKSSTIGGASLAHHPIEWLTEPGRIGIKEPFQLVVLADGSSQPLSEKRRTQSRQIIRQHAETIRKRGGEVALYMTHTYVPPHREAKPENLVLTARHYIDTANEIKALVIPVALAFDEAYRRRPGIVLHTDYDGSHPDVLGTYLAACVTYGSVYGKPCKGNAYTYYGRVKAEDAAFLQEVADEVVKRFFGR
mgnify:CR=1 FL=1